MYTNDPSEKTAALRQAKKLSDIGTTDPRYFLTMSGYSFMASDTGQFERTLIIADKGSYVS